MTRKKLVIFVNVIIIIIRKSLLVLRLFRIYIVRYRFADPINISIFYF